MNRTMIASVFFLLASSLLPAAAAAEHNSMVEDVNVVNGDFRVPAGETVERTVLVTSGIATIEGTLRGSCIADGADIVVTGRVAGSVFSYAKGRSITVKGEVTQTVFSYDGRVYVSGKTGAINAFGSAVEMGPSSSARILRAYHADIRTEPGAAIKGGIERLTNREFPRYLSSYSVYNRIVDLRRGMLNETCLAVGVGITLLLPFVFLLRRTESAAVQLEAEFWRSCGTGLLVLGALLLSCFGLLKAAKGAFFLCIPLLAVLIAMAIMGASAFARSLGTRLAALAGKARPGPLTAAVIGYLTLVVVMVVIVDINQLTDAGRGPGGLLSRLPFYAGLFIVYVDMAVMFFGTTAGMGALVRCSPNPFRKE